MSGVAAKADASGGDSPTGETLLNAECNPFYVDPRRGVMWVVGALITAAVIYVGIMFICQYRLQQKIRQADGLTQILQSSTFYPQKKNAALEPSAKVDTLAIAVWLDELKLAPPDTDFEQLLDDNKYQVLAAALRFGGHCEGKRGDLQPLVMPSVKRLVELGAFFAVNCHTNSASGIAAVVVDEMTRLIAEKKSSGSDLFKRVLVAYSVFDALTDKPVVAPNVSVMRTVMALNAAAEAAKAAEAAPALKSPQDKKNYEDAASKLEAAKREVGEIQKRLEQAKKAILPEEMEDRSGALDARLLVYGLNALKAKGDKSDLADPRMRAVETFATALVGSIESDPDVSSARRWLDAVAGFEMYLILALAFATGGLMIERHLTFRRHRAGVVTVIEELTRTLPGNGDDTESADSKDKRQKRRDTQAEIALTRRAAIQTISAQPLSANPPSAIVTDMSKAVRSDLSQIHLYGMSEERVDKVAEDLKDKIDASRQLIEWGVTTLPALGFLGTVRGILMALSAVGGLSQGDSVARLGALLNVSGALGIAFATTLLALVCMIILSYADIRQARGEKELVDGLRDFLNDRVLP